MNTISCASGVTLIACARNEGSEPSVCVGTESAPPPHEKALSSISPSLRDQPQSLRPNHQNMPAEEGGGPWKLAERSFSDATLAFFASYISITQTELEFQICFFIMKCKGLEFLLYFFEEEIWQDISHDRGFKIPC